MTAAEAAEEVLSILSDTESKIIRQIEYYFGDYNLSRDKFLKDIIKSDEGWVPIDTMLKFERLSKISLDSKAILSSIKKSESGLMEVDDEKEKIRRCPNKPLPEEEEILKEYTKRSVYVKGFEKEKTTLDDLLDYFTKHDNVANLCMRNWSDKRDKSKKNFKGSIIVTFNDRESAEKFLALESVKNPAGEELVRKWQEDYNEEKKIEFEEKKKKNQEHKFGAKKVKELVEKTESAAESQEKKPEENLLPKGAVLYLENLNETTTREILRAKLEEEFEVGFKDIAFIYFNKGEPNASLRFKEEDAAKNLVTKIAQSLVKVEGEETAKKFEINGVEVQFSALEGEKETAFLSKCLADMTHSRGNGRGGGRGGHKRRGGFQGGRGGGSKRPRR